MAKNESGIFYDSFLFYSACRQLLGTPPYARYAASTTRSKKHGKTCTAEDGHYYSNKAWCAKRQNGKAFLILRYPYQDSILKKTYLIIIIQN